MPDKSFKIGEDVYDIPEGDVSSFIKDNPKAVEIETFTIKNDTFDIPIAEKDLFLKDNPEATSIKKKNTSETFTPPSEAFLSSISGVPILGEIAKEKLPSDSGTLESEPGKSESTKTPIDGVVIPEIKPAKSAIASGDFLKALAGIPIIGDVANEKPQAQSETGSVTISAPNDQGYSVTTKDAEIGGDQPLDESSVESAKRSFAEQEATEATDKLNRFGDIIKNEHYHSNQIFDATRKDFRESYLTAKAYEDMAIPYNDVLNNPVAPILEKQAAQAELEKLASNPRYQEAQQKVQNYYKTYDALRADVENKVKQVAAYNEKNASYLEGSASSFYNGVANILDGLEGTGRFISDYTGLTKVAGKQNFLFADLASEIRKGTSTWEKPPEGALGEIVAGTAGMAPMIIQTMFLPESELTFPTLMAQQNFGEQYQKTGDLAESTQSGLEGAALGIGFHYLGMAGGTSGKLIGKLSEETLGKTASGILDKGTAALVTSSGFGGQAALSQYLQTGQWDWKTFNVGAGQGLAFSIPGFFKASHDKAVTDFINTSPDAIKQMVESPRSVNELSDKSVELMEKAPDITNPEEQTQAVMASQGLRKIANVKSITQQIVDNPNYATSLKLDISNAENLSPEIKQAAIDKIDQVAAENNPNASEINNINKQIDLLQKGVELNNQNKFISEADRDAQNKNSETKIKELKDNLSNLYNPKTETNGEEKSKQESGKEGESQNANGQEVLSTTETDGAKEVTATDEIKTSPEQETKPGEVVSNEVKKITIKGKSYEPKNIDGEMLFVDENGKTVEPRYKSGGKNKKHTELLDEYVKNTEFDNGTEADLSDFEGANENDMARIDEAAVERSSNPAEIAELFVRNLDNRTPLEMSHKEEIMAEHLGKIKRNGYTRFGDRNNITFGKARSWFGPEGEHIDSKAQELSEIAGVEITPKDIIEYIDRFPNGHPSKKARLGESRTSNDAADKFEKLTGIELNKSLAEKILNKETTKLKLQENEGYLDKLTDAELEQLSSERELSDTEAGKIYSQENTGTSSETEGTQNIEEKTEGEETVNENTDNAESEQSNTGEGTRSTDEGSQVEGNKEAAEGEKTIDPKIGDPLRSIADILRKGKLDDGTAMAGIPFAKQIWNGAIEVSARAIEGGADIADAIKQGLDYIKNTDWYKNLRNEDRLEAEEKFNGAFTDEIKEAQKIIDNERIKVRAEVEQDYKNLEKILFGSETQREYAKGNGLTLKTGKLQDATIGKLKTKVMDGIDRAVEKQLQSQNPVMRTLAKSLNAAFRFGITPERLSKYSDFIGGKNRAIGDAVTSNKILKDIVGNNKESLRRVHEVMDHELYRKEFVLTYDDLTSEEKKLHDTLRAINDAVHKINFSIGKLDYGTYAKNKGKYIARAYEMYELPQDSMEAMKDATKKMKEDIYKQRGELDNWKLENKITDPVYLTTKRLNNTLINKAVYDYSQYISKEKPELVSTAPKEGYTLLERGYGDLSGKYVLDSVAEDFKGFFFQNHTIQKAYDLFKAWDKLKPRQFYKKLFTIYNPGTQLGNIMGDNAFAFLVGVDPITLNKNIPNAIKEAKEYGPTYRYLIEKGLLKSDLTRDDLTNSLRDYDNMIEEASKSKNPFTYLKDAANKVYSSVDDVYKMAAFKSLVDKGISQEQAIKQVENGFQNGNKVPKLYDFTSKIPVFGNPFGRWGADLSRIVFNSATTRPLNAAAYIGGLTFISWLSSALSEESEQEKRIRTSRPGAAKMVMPDWLGGDVSLSYKLGNNELNVARFLTPLYIYNTPDGADVSQALSKFSPLPIEGVDKSNNPNGPIASWIGKNNNDPLTTWLDVLPMIDADYTGKSVLDPNSTIYKKSPLRPEEKFVNAMKFLAKNYIPYEREGSYIYDAAMGQDDEFGRQRTVPQALMKLIGIKLEKFGDDKYQRSFEGLIKSRAYEFMDNAKIAASIRKDYDDKKITAELYRYRMANIIEEQAKIISNIQQEKDKVNGEFKGVLANDVLKEIKGYSSAVEKFKDESSRNGDPEKKTTTTKTGGHNILRKFKH